MQALLVKFLTSLLLEFGHRLIAFVVSSIKKKIKDKNREDEIEETTKDPDRRNAARNASDIFDRV